MVQYIRTFHVGVKSSYTYITGIFLKLFMYSTDVLPCRPLLVLFYGAITLIIHVNLHPPKISHFGILAAAISLLMATGIQMGPGSCWCLGPADPDSLLSRKKQCCTALSATGYKLGLLILCTDFWFFLDILLWSPLTCCKIKPFCVRILYFFHEMFFILRLMNDLGDLVFTTPHHLSHTCKQANSCLATKSIISTGVLLFFWIYFC